LQRLSKTHVIGENAPVALEVPEAHHAPKHKLHALALMLAQVLAQHAVDTNAPPALAESLGVLFLPQHLRNINVKLCGSGEEWDIQSLTRTFLSRIQEFWVPTPRLWEAKPVRMLRAPESARGVRRAFFCGGARRFPLCASRHTVKQMVSKECQKMLCSAATAAAVSDAQLGTQIELQ
jgi:hypothetical protein